MKIASWSKTRSTYWTDTGEVFEEEINKMDRLFWLQNLKNIIEDGKTVDTMRDETHDNVADRLRTHQETVKAMCRKNKKLKEKIMTQYRHMKNQTKYVQLDHVELLKNRMNKACAYMARVI